MPPAWPLYAFQFIEPDEQLDLFACREMRRHLVLRQLELDGGTDRTLCGQLLPASPCMRPLARRTLSDPRLCPACRQALAARRRGLRPAWC